MTQTGRPEKGPEYYNQLYAGRYDANRYAPLYDIIMPFLAAIGRPRVLEVGCGVGTLGKRVIENGYEYRGFDFSSVAVQQAQSHCPEGRFEVGDAYDVRQYRPYDYDLVIALEVLEHLTDLAIIDMIPPGVRLLASVPNFDDTAHLRIYEDVRRDIVERFQGRLQLLSYRSLPGKGPNGDPRLLYLFDAIRLHSDDWYERNREYLVKYETAAV